MAGRKCYSPVLLLLMVAQVDITERFKYSTPFSDPDGDLSLSPKQKLQFGGWVRPTQLTQVGVYGLSHSGLTCTQHPKMIVAVSSDSIKQTLVSDCSFVSSLAISADYERRFKRRLITDSIYPQNRQGQPIVNPSGAVYVTQQRH